MRRKVILTQLSALAIGWTLSACVGPLQGVDVEVGTTVQRGKDPLKAPGWSKGCTGLNSPYCPPPHGSAPVYGVGFGIVAGAAVDFRVGLLTLRPYLGVRYEHYFERAQLGDSPTNSLALEAGFGLGMSRIELRPTIGIGALTVAGHWDRTRVVTVGFSLSTRVIGGLLVGTFLHYNLSPYPNAYDWSDRYIRTQTVDAPILGLEAAYRFKVL